MIKDIWRSFSQRYIFFINIQHHISVCLNIKHLSILKKWPWAHVNIDIQPLSKYQIHNGIHKYQKFTNNKILFLCVCALQCVSIGRYIDCISNFQSQYEQCVHNTIRSWNLWHSLAFFFFVYIFCATVHIVLHKTGFKFPSILYFFFRE